MVVPKLKRVNTLGIQFIKGEKCDDILEKIIEDKLGIPVNELAGLADYGPKRHMIKVRTEQMYKHLCDRYVGYPIRVDRDHEIELNDLSSYKDRVKVTRVPFEMSSSVLKDLMGRYGEVENVIMCSKRDGKFKNIPIDQAIVWMKVLNPIPSSLWIAETQGNMFFSYEKQPRTCHKCGSLQHKANECDVFMNTLPKDRQNAVNIELYEESQEANVSVSQPGEGTPPTEEGNPSTVEGDPSTDSDDSIRSTLTTDSESDNEDNLISVESEFACSECDRKCTTGHELNEHRKTHSETYADRVKSPPKQNSEQSPVTITNSIGISASQPTGSSQHKASTNNLRKRGASASPTSDVSRERKVHKVNTHKNNKRLVWYKY